MTAPVRLLTFVGVVVVAFAVPGVAVASQSGAERKRFCEPSEVEVLGSSFFPKLKAVRKKFLPGETAYARLENRGSETIAFGYPYDVERFIDGSWEKAPGAPSGPWLLPLLHMQSGEAGRCVAYRIPLNVEPGAFRFVKRVFPAKDRTRLRIVKAAFRVLPR